MAYFSLGNIAAGVGVVASLAWIAQLVHVVANRRKAVRLADLPADEPGDGWPDVAVIVAARDEEAKVEKGVRSLLALDYPGLEVIVVDDRSSDRTGTILDEIARDDRRLQVVHVAELPAGWLGKTHALQRGSETTDAPWFLFTDADVILAPGALRRAIALAECDRLDHLAAAPDTIGETVGERIFLALFALLFAFKAPIGRVDDRRSRAYIGVGAFNLVRAQTFRDIGGLERVRLSVDDDMRLGQAIKFAGYRNKFVLGNRDVTVRWHVGMGGMVRGLEKNFFAAVDFRPGLAIFTALAILVLAAGPMVGIFVGPWWTRAICGLGIAASIALLGLVGSSSRVGPWYALTIPISGFVLAYALLRSMTLTLLRKGVSWRGRFYPLRELKAHVRLRNLWLHEVWYSTR
jgi:glycosyltransferase involved in cell wall biosynthesis